MKNYSKSFEGEDSEKQPGYNIQISKKGQPQALDDQKLSYERQGLLVRYLLLVDFVTVFFMHNLEANLLSR